jgi:hypothetical protein
LERYGTLYGQQLDIRNWVNAELGVWASIRLLQGGQTRKALRVLESIE